MSTSLRTTTIFDLSAYRRVQLPHISDSLLRLSAPLADKVGPLIVFKLLIPD